MQYSTFGMCIDSLIKQRNIPKIKFAEMIDEERTTLNRIINDECSYEIASRLVKKILETDDLKISESEKNIILQELNSTKVKKQVHLSRQRLMSIFKDIETSSESRCIKSIGDDISKIDTVTDLLERCFIADENTPISIYIENCMYADVSDTLAKLLLQNANISIYHFFSYTSQESKLAEELIALQKMSCNDNYFPYRCKKTVVLDNSINIITKNKSDTSMYIYDVVNYKDDNSFTHLHNRSDDIMEKFLTTKYIDLMKTSEFLKQPMGDTKNFNLLTSYLMDMLKVEEFPSIAIKESPCFVSVPYDVMYDMAGDTIFKQKNENLSSIQKIKDIVYKRWEMFTSGNLPKKFIFTKEGIVNFLTTGYLSDHFFIFRPLTMKERADVINMYINRCKSNEPFEFRLINDEYKIPKIGVLFVEGYCINYFQSSAGYGEGFFNAKVTDKKLVKIYNDFVYNELWEKHTVSKEESLLIMEQLLNEYQLCTTL